MRDQMLAVEGEQELKVYAERVKHRRGWVCSKLAHLGTVIAGAEAFGSFRVARPPLARWAEIVGAGAESAGHDQVWSEELDAWAADVEALDPDRATEPGGSPEPVGRIATLPPPRMEQPMGGGR